MTTLKNIAEATTNTTPMNLTNLKKALEEYFFEGEGKKFAPWNEARPTKPGKKIKKLLEDAGFDFVSDGVSLQETSYVFTIMTGYADNVNWTDVSIDYWTQEVEFNGERF